MRISLGGRADLPLHGGRVPRWMLGYMERMAKAIAEAVVEIWGPNRLVEGLSDPYWFQAFNNAIGMDWDSSGSTTVLLGVLKSVTWRNPGMGVLVLGGKGGRMRSVVEEAGEASKILGDLDPESIRSFSRSSARLDSVFLQDGYELYHHSVIVSGEGRMVVVQQGMNADAGMARRYHLVEASFDRGHTAIAGVRSGQVLLNSLGPENREARRAYIDILHEGPSRVKRMLAEANRIVEGRPSLEDYVSGRVEPRAGPKPYYKPVKPSKSLTSSIERLAMNPPTSEDDLLAAEGLGPATLRALALIADLIYSVPTSTRDPANYPLNPFVYAYTVGGKDGVPYRYSRETAERVILTLEEAIDLAKLGRREKLEALMRLRRLVRRAQRGETG